MPLLGEVPITSFFKPNPDSKKRKAKATSAPSLKKRKNEYPEGSTKDPEVTRWFTRKEEELDHVSSIINVRPCEAPKRMFSVGQSARTSKTPSMMATKKKDSGHEHLNSNSPVTHEAPPRKRQSTASGSGHSHNAPKFSDYEIDRKLVYFLPTPVTMKRQSSRQLRCQGCHTDETPSKKINSGAITIPTTLNLEPMDSDVPSSQSQNISPMTHSLSTGPALLEKPPSFLAPPPNSVLRSAQKDEHNPDILDGRDAQLPVDSSQSQMFGSLDEQPRSPGAIHLLCLPEEDSVSTIPSSQSQESELIMPHLEMKARLQKTKTQPRYRLSRSSSTKTGTTPNQIPRMLSDELFSAPIQHSLLGEIRQKDDFPEDSLRASDFAQPAENPDDLSATESESESEAGELLRPSNQLANPAIHDALVRQWHFSPHGSPHHITTYDDSLGGESLSSRLSQSTVASPESSYSFPFAVREFRNMFGSNDESYPPDFPMSLR